MPIKKRNGRSKRRVVAKKGVKRHRRAGAIRSVSYKGCPFGEQLNTTFTYAENFTLASLAGLPATYEFSTNSLHDPNFTGTGIQPRYFDSLCGPNNGTAPYKSYRVYSSKITVEVLNINDSIGDRGFVGIGCYTSNSSAPSDLTEMRERADYKTKFMGIYTGGRDLCKFSRTMANKTLFGIKDMKDDEETAAVYNASPVKAGRWAITYIPADESTSGGARCLCKIVYRCQLFNRNDVADS